MSEKGWDASVEPDNRWSVSGIPDDQLDREEADSAACEAQFGYDQAPPPITREEAEATYVEMLDVATCVRNLGFPVSDPPSEQTYVDDLVSNRFPWNPYDAIWDGLRNNQLNLSDLAEAEAKCPIPSQ